MHSLIWKCIPACLLTVSDEVSKNSILHVIASCICFPVTQCHKRQTVDDFWLAEDIAMVFGAEYGQQEAEEKDHQTEAYQAYYWKENNFVY